MIHEKGGSTLIYLLRCAVALASGQHAIVHEHSGGTYQVVFKLGLHITIGPHLFSQGGNSIVFHVLGIKLLGLCVARTMMVIRTPATALTCAHN